MFEKKKMFTFQILCENTKNHAHVLIPLSNIHTYVAVIFLNCTAKINIKVYSALDITRVNYVLCINKKQVL